MPDNTDASRATSSYTDDGWVGNIDPNVTFVGQEWNTTKTKRAWDAVFGVASGATKGSAPSQKKGGKSHGARFRAKIKEAKKAEQAREAEQAKTARSSE